MQLRAVDQQSAERREVDLAAALGGSGPWLGELAGDTADPDDWLAGSQPHHTGQRVEQAKLAAEHIGHALARSLRTSSHSTKGGSAARSVRILSISQSSPQSGCCAAGSDRQ